ncbi:hypothetical protein BDA99DRAFT_253995 [Phascolomyces articulosus]|uniref:Uncharacterized protein n=1 Tax=Phascolomyces articulosus TaxID=60185 RepID=A0AAD5JZ61_9FUNG|nr:hypothetical protein BDA99DRAFT_253995 [Phascolomyces articulosus]
MPLYYKHDRRNELFPPITQGQHTPVLPVARVTRNDIESRLQISIETRKKVNQIYTTYHNERKRQPTPTLKSIPSLHLFPHDASSQQQSFTRTNHGNETGSLPLYKVPRFSLFQPLSNTPKAHSTSQPTPPPPTLLMLHTEQYAQQRRAMVDDQGNPCFVVDDSNNNSISSAATAVTFNTPQERSIPSTTTIPSQQQQQLVIPETPVTRTTTSLSSPSTFLESVRKQFVPILATSMQQQGCDKLAQLAQTRDGSFLKINFESMIGLLNHPLIALMDEYEETTADKWSGSGKTHFIKQLVDILRKENMPLKITIATYDIDTESFLFDCIRNHLQLPCLRIGSVLDDAWEREYGVIFQTLKTRESVVKIRPITS